MHIPLDKIALIAIDLQHGFCNGGGSTEQMGRDITTMHAAGERTIELAKVARNAGMPIIWTQITWRADYQDGGLMTGVLRPGLKANNALQRGGQDAALMSEIEVYPTDFVVDKPRHSAFYASSLEAILRSHRIEGLLVCGVTTSMCVETTVRDACQRDIAAFVVEECVADFATKRHEASLEVMAVGFANVISYRQAEAGIGAGGFDFHAGK
ncbi:MAG: cysteine hydrolase [Proteobacteria bacterium]|nr:cysteine hydrolase [Pseudomonadota bacterium]